MRRSTLGALALVGIVSVTLAGQRQGGAAPAGRQDAGAAGRQGDAAGAPGRQGDAAGAPGRQGGAAGAPGRQGAAGGAGRQGGPAVNGRQGRGAPVRDRAAQTGTAVIRGRVVAADTGAPLRRVEVQANSGGRTTRGALTDSEGVFELRDLPAGTWMVRASKSGFIAQQFGQRTAFGPAEPVELADGGQFTAQFALARAGAITGRVFDEYGDPVANVRVGALRAQWSPTGRRLTAAGSTVVSDDTGAFRVYGLAPGRYYVTATAMGPGAGNAFVTTSDGPVTYSPVFFPGTTDLAMAEPVPVAVGQEQSNINVSLTPSRAVRVSGIVLGSGGAPVQAMLTLHSPGIADLPGGGRNANSDAQGSFTLPNVAPGTYTLEVAVRTRSNNVASEVAAVPLNVGTEDMSGLTITTGSGGTIDGTITTDNGARIPLDGVRVTAPPMRASQRAWLPRAQATDTGFFALNGLIGPHSLRFEQLPAGWVIKSVTAGTVDVSDLPIDFRGTEQVSVRVVLTQKIASLTGTVRSNTPSRGASVVVFPDEPAKWTVISRFVRTARVGETGQFTIGGLPPHQRYLAVALEYLESGEHLDPDLLQALRQVATPFSLPEGEQQSVELTLLDRP